MGKVSETSLKSIIKWWIRNVDKRKNISMSRIFAEIDEITVTAYKRKYSPESIYRRFREAKIELVGDYQFKKVQKKSAEDWFRIVKI
jgi:hypothetical protein